MSILVKDSHCHGWRFLVYGVILVNLLFFYSEGNGFLRSVTKENKSVAQGVVENNEQPKMRGNKGLRFLRTRSGPLNPNNATGSYPRIKEVETLNLRETLADDPRNLGNVDIEHDAVIENEIENLLNEREAIYGESRTLSVSEVVDLHNAKDNEDYQFAITNEAQLILRELAIEHRIPQECAEDLSNECLIVLERSQAGSMPPGCENPQSTGECEQAFSQFWE